jgi:hypothetical protein
MFPESFVEEWLPEVSRPGERVLDPFCGRGTTLFQALLMNRRAVGSDVNPVAYCVTKAKTNAPSAPALRRQITLLEASYQPDRWNARAAATPEFFHRAFHKRTLRQLLYLRSRLQWRRLNTDCMLAALTLGILHGESQKSRFVLSNQMPRTISTKPEYSVRFWKEHRLRAPERDVFRLLENAVNYRYESPRPKRTADVFLADMRRLPDLDKFPDRIRCVITSPPYLDVTRYEEDQWLRLWFLGGPTHPTYGVVSRDDRIENPAQYWRMISDMWRTLGRVCSKDTRVVLRLGGIRTTTQRLADGLAATAHFSRRKVKVVDQRSSQLPRRQTDVFRPGSTGCRSEVDVVFRMD